MRRILFTALFTTGLSVNANAIDLTATDLSSRTSTTMTFSGSSTVPMPFPEDSVDFGTSTIFLKADVPQMKPPVPPPGYCSPELLAQAEKAVKDATTALEKAKEDLLAKKNEIGAEILKLANKRVADDPKLKDLVEFYFGDISKEARGPASLDSIIADGEKGWGWGVNGRALDKDLAERARNHYKTYAKLLGLTLDELDKMTDPIKKLKDDLYKKIIALEAAKEALKKLQDCMDGKVSSVDSFDDIVDYILSLESATAL